jgi:hypothetical protein
VPISREGFFELDLLAPTNSTLPFCAVSDIGPLVSLILESPRDHDLFQCKPKKLRSIVTPTDHRCRQARGPRQ